MDPQTSPNQQATPGTAHLASGSAFLGLIESSVVEWGHLEVQKTSCVELNALRRKTRL